MASSFTANASLEKPATGEQSGSWGTTLNTNFDSIDTAIFGYLSKSVAGASDVTLTAAEALNRHIIFTGVLTGAINVIVPTVEGWWIVQNTTTGAFSLTVKTSAGTGAAILRSEKALVYCDGTNVARFNQTYDEMGIESGAVASATTTDIWAEAGTVHVTGTTTITSFGTAPQAGAWKKVIFDGALTLTHGANLNLPGSANITTAANDWALVYADTTTLFRVLYFKLNGEAVVTELSRDTTPQLGGTLDSNAKQIRWSKGADVASATALTLGTDGNYFDITGTTTITSIGTLAVGTVVKLHFDGALTFTHHATDLILPGAANITTAAGDEAELVEYAAGDWRCTSYTKADGTAVVANSGSVVAYRVTSTSNVAVATQASGGTQIGGNVSVTLAAGDIIRLSLVQGRATEGNTSGGRIAFGINVNSVAYWNTVNINGGGADAKPEFVVTQNQYVETLGGKNYNGSEPIILMFDVTALSIATGAQTLQVIGGDGLQGTTGEMTMSGATTTTSFLVEVITP